MDKLKQDDLYTLEAYSRERAAFRARVLAHKQPRTVALGASVTLVFEDRLTIQYQIQEMLRVERVFEPAGIADELGAYNPLIPDGRNLKATMLIEYPDADERARELARLRGIERHVVAEVAGAGAAELHADEDLDRSTAQKTSAVHFLRFEFSDAQRAALRGGAALVFRIDDERYAQRAEAGPELLAELLKDFD